MHTQLPSSSPPATRTLPLAPETGQEPSPASRLVFGFPFFCLSWETIRNRHRFPSPTKVRRLVRSGCAFPPPPGGCTLGGCTGCKGGCKGRAAAVGRPTLKSRFSIWGTSISWREWVSQLDSIMFVLLDSLYLSTWVLEDCPKFSSHGKGY